MRQITHFLQSVSLDPASFRSGLKAAANRAPKDDSSALSESGKSKPALTRHHTVGGGEGFRRGGAAAGPGMIICGQRTWS